jgi:hypothetical protein
VDLYNVNNSALGNQRIYFNPIPGAGLTGAIYNQYRRTDDPIGLGCQTIFCNLENNSLHAVSLPNRLTTQTLAATDVVEDVAVFDVSGLVFSHTVLNDSNFSGLVAIFNGSDTAGAGHWNPALMIENKELTFEDFSYKDIIKSNAGADTTYRPKFIVEIEGYVPDGNRYMMKKFRSVEIQGIFPQDNSAQDFFVSFAPESKAYPVDVPGFIIDTPPAIDRPHYPHRIGVNVRGRFISLRIAVGDTLLLPDVTNNWKYFEISDIRFLWSYVGRGPIHSSIP